MSDEKKQGLFELIDGLEAVEPGVLAKFEDAMTKTVIPEIVRVVEDRRLFAAETRQRPLKV